MGAVDTALAPESLLAREPLEFDLPDVSGKRIMVTGGEGFVGERVRELLTSLGALAVSADLPEVDVRDPFDLCDIASGDAIIHLAAHKYATTAEEHPGEVAALNIAGTQNVVDLGVPVILASTCKAADPCTVYGASKLIAERIVLNAGGTVVRLVNVLGSTGSVLELWARQGHHEVTRCRRMWMTPDEAAEFMVVALDLPPGRYIPDVGEPEPVLALYRRTHSQPVGQFAPLRRGDRPLERLISENEHPVDFGPGWLRIEDRWGT